MKKNKLMPLLSLILLSSSSLYFLSDINSSTTYAASFTAAENEKISNFQSKYRHLDASIYNNGNLYTRPPFFGVPFDSGALKPSYISTSMNWINYYRELVGLPDVNNTNNLNKQSQIAASSMAAAQSNPGITQHGLYNSVKPSYVPQNIWDSAATTTIKSNLYFRTAAETAGYPISSLIIDNTNIDGQNTGHRAWLLSSRLSSVGIGASYNGNDKFENIQVVNDQDSNNTAQKDVVTYPGSGVFPIEEMQDYSPNWNLVVPWSIYFSNADDPFTNNTQVTITNKDTNQSFPAANIETYIPDSGSKYTLGNFTGVLTYLPPENMHLTENTEYQIDVTGLNPSKVADGNYSYTFKTFTQQTAARPYTADNSIETPFQKEITVKTENLPVYNSPASGNKKTGKYLTADSKVTAYGTNYQNGHNWFNIGKNQWVNGKYIEDSIDYKSGILTIATEEQKPLSIWSSPYADHKRTNNKVKNNSAWIYNQKISVDGNTWYRISRNGWIEGKFTK